jgi:hypothetical protein
MMANLGLPAPAMFLHPMVGYPIDDVPVFPHLPSFRRHHHQHRPAVAGR